MAGFTAVFSGRGFLSVALVTRRLWIALVLLRRRASGLINAGGLLVPTANILHLGFVMAAWQDRGKAQRRPSRGRLRPAMRPEVHWRCRGAMTSRQADCIQPIVRADPMVGVFPQPRKMPPRRIKSSVIWSRISDVAADMRFAVSRLAARNMHGIRR